MIRIAGTPHHLALACIGFQHEKTGFEIGFSHSLQDSPAHVKGHTGYHHLALTAESKEQVDTIHESLLRYYKEHGGETGDKASKILDAPRMYPEYGPSYYALFFTDPDGLKLEIAV
ncbi:hypothetical protein BGZ70_002577 [Mortierella alpina]|uniref:VOC domain-containing protein n=1 Tax=Mortierella alpina TaxID=64518 RepID=A0A9P6ITX2_MORAP|nr:hypothetical protein BGZ70_002577 [Mortierella alpina]